MTQYEEPRMVTNYPYDIQPITSRSEFDIRAKALELALAPGLSEEDIVNRAKAFEAFLRGH